MGVEVNATVGAKVGPLVSANMVTLARATVDSTIGAEMGALESAVGALVGASLGPIVYGHYYVIYIRPVKKKQNLDVEKKKGMTKRK